MQTDLTIKGDIEVLRLQPGDILIVTTTRPLTAEQASILHKQVTEFAPGHKIAVCSSDLRITAAREEHLSEERHEQLAGYFNGS